MDEFGKSLTLDIAQKIDRACDKFEAAWQSGQQPRIEDYLSVVAPQHVEHLIRSLLRVELELLNRECKDVSEESYKARFAEYGDVITEVLESFCCRSSHEKKSHSQHLPRPGDTVNLKDVDIDTSQSHRAGDGKSGDARQRRLGRFQILEAVGKGAFGTVYRAYDPQLDREVALKLPRAGVLETQEDVERFLREARSAATLRHSHICPIYDFGKIGDEYFIVMAYISGKPLSSVLTKSKEITSRKIAVVVRKIAIALAAAHQQDVIHRDLKPSNIMIDQHGEPVLMDFGLARRISDEEAQLTHSGAILGTPAYMSPEQARGMSKAVGATSDIYSLGVIFYELLCGRRPFEGPVAEVMSAVLRDKPQPPSAHRADVDPELEKICLKAMSKEPQERYQSMDELADGLAAYLRKHRLLQMESESVSPETAPPKPNAAQFEQPAALKTRFILSPNRTAKSANGFDPYHKWLGIAPEEQPADHYRLLGLNTFETDADVIEAAADRQMAYLHQINAGPHVTAAQMLLNELATAKLCLLNPKAKAEYDAQLLARTMIDQPAEEHASADGHPADELAGISPRTLRQLRVFNWWIRIDRRLVMSGAGLVAVLLGVVIVIQSKYGTTRIETDIEKPVVSINPLTDEIGIRPSRSVNSSPQKAPPASGNSSRFPKDTNAYRSPQELHRLQAVDANNDTYALAFTPDGKKLITGNQDQHLRVWDVESGQLISSIKTPTSGRGIAISPNGLHVAYCGVAATTCIWEIESGKLVRRLHSQFRYPGMQMGIDYSPDGKRIAVSCLDGFARIWESDSGGEVQKFAIRVPRNGGCSINFTPDGNHVLVKGSPSQVQMFDAHTGVLIKEFDLGPDSAGGPNLAISPDGQQFVICTFRGQAIVYDLKTGNKIGDGSKGVADVSSVLFSPDGRWIAAGHHHGSVQLLDARTHTQRFKLNHERAHVGSLAFSTDSRYLASATIRFDKDHHTGGDIRIWRMPDVDEISGDTKQPGIEPTDDAKPGEKPNGALPDYAYLLTGEWKTLFPSAEMLKDQPDMTSHDGVIEIKGTAKLDFGDKPIKDAIIRARIRKLAGQGNPSIWLRRNHSDGYGAGLLGFQQFRISKRTSTGSQPLGIYKASRRYDDFVEWALAVVGDRITLYIDGKQVLEARDRTFREGLPAIGALNCHTLFRNVEIMSLDHNRPLASAPTADYANLLTGKWEPVLRSADDLKTQKEMSFHDGVIEINGHDMLAIGNQPFRDGIIRAKVKILGGKHPTIRLRKSSELDGYYAICHKRRDFKITKHINGTDWETLAASAADFEHTGFFEWALAAVGDEITVYVDGKKVLEVRDDTFSEGLPAIGGLDCHALFRDVEIMKLEGRVPAAPQPKNNDDSFNRLFNGKNQEGWIQYGAGIWTINDGVLTGTIHKSGDLARLTTKRHYRDYELEFEYRMVSGSTGFVFLHTPQMKRRNRNPKRRNPRVFVNLVDNDNDIPRRFDDARNGGLYKFAAPVSDPQFPIEELNGKPVGKWNKMRIQTTDLHVEVTLNDKLVTNCQIDATPYFRGIQRGGNRNKILAVNAVYGAIEFMVVKNSIEFRNIRIREIDKKTSTPNADVSSSDES